MNPKSGWSENLRDKRLLQKQKAFQIGKLFVFEAIPLIVNSNLGNDFNKEAIFQKLIDETKIN
jgi:hypothetical protein